MSWFGRAAACALFVLVMASGRAVADPSPCAFLLPVPAEGLSLPAEVAEGSCEERDRFTLHDNQYLFVDVRGYETDGAAARMDLARDAAVRAINFYSQWLDVPDIIFISGRFPLVSLGEGSTTLAIATGDFRGCVILLEHVSQHAGRPDGSSDANHYKRTIAHEMFHCVQITDRSVHNSYVPWRDESTAEAFSGIVIPESHVDPLYLDAMPMLAASAISTLGHGAYPYAAWVATQTIPENLVTMLKNAARDGSEDGSARTLASLPDAANLFHSFVKAYLDGHLVDEMARAILPPAPEIPDAVVVSDEMTYTLAGLTPHSGTFQMFELGQGIAWKVEYPDDPNLRVSWRVFDGAEWTALPATIEACDAPRRGVIVVTSAAPNAAMFNVPLKFSRDPEGMRNCACPVGSWYMDEDMVRASPLSLTMPGTLEGGTMSLQFNADGTASATYHDIKFRSEIDRDSAMVTVMRGTINFRWVAKPWDAAVSGEPAPTGEGVQALAIERTVTASNVHWRVEFWGRDGMINASERTPPARDQGSINIATALCMDGVLTLGQGASAVRHALPPWYGMFKRAG
ncbi:MAG TPA: hypothetical protein PLA85_08475 [Micropepsaceae bacterium]|nr:hypothetical protein [Micropepsaceae bacterium]